MRIFSLVKSESDFLVNHRFGIGAITKWNGPGPWGANGGSESTKNWTMQGRKTATIYSLRIFLSTLLPQTRTIKDPPPIPTQTNVPQTNDQRPIYPNNVPQTNVPQTNVPLYLHVRSKTNVPQTNDPKQAGVKNATCRTVSHHKTRPYLTHI